MDQDTPTERVQWVMSLYKNARRVQLCSYNIRKASTPAPLRHFQQRSGASGAVLMCTNGLTQLMDEAVVDNYMSL